MAARKSNIRKKIVNHDIGGDSGLRLGNDVRVILLSLLPDGGVNVGFVDSVA